jgi:hypothetical protein
VSTRAYRVGKARRRKPGETKKAFDRRVAKLERQRARYSSKKEKAAQPKSDPANDLEPLPPPVPPPPPRAFVSPHDKAARRRAEMARVRARSDREICALRGLMGPPPPVFDDLVEWRGEGQFLPENDGDHENTLLEDQCTTGRPAESLENSSISSNQQDSGQGERGERDVVPFPVSPCLPRPKTEQKTDNIAKSHSDRRPSIADLWSVPTVVAAAPGPPTGEAAPHALPALLPGASVASMFHVKHRAPNLPRWCLAEMHLVLSWLTQVRVILPRPAPLVLRLRPSDRAGISLLLLRFGPEGYDPQAPPSGCDDVAITAFADRLRASLRKMGGRTWSASELLVAVADEPPAVRSWSPGSLRRLPQRYERCVEQEISRGTFALLTDDDDGDGQGDDSGPNRSASQR